LNHAGDPYATRGARSVKATLKINFALARTLVGKEVSFGKNRAASPDGFSISKRY